MVSENDVGGSVLRERRLAAHLTQRQLAMKADVSLGAIRDIEQGRTSRLRPASLKRVVGVLGSRFEEQPPDWPDADLWLQVLGPLVGARNGQLLMLGAPKQRAVLAMLALRPNIPTHRDAILDCIWGERIPANGVNLVQSYIARLRRSLDPQRTVVCSDGAAYWLHLAEGQLDLLAAEKRERLAEAQAAAGSLDNATDLYESAVDLWRDSPVSDVAALREWPVVVSLVRRWSDLTLRFARTAAAAGHVGRALPQMWALCGREPLNEPAHIELMLALARTGQQPAALLAFEQLRTRLDEELGVLPGHEIGEVHESILRREILPAVGRSIRLRQGDRAGICQLPPDIVDFTGRAHERKLLSSLLTAPGDGVPIAVISGPPGAGKTALSARAGHALRASFPDGQLFVQMAGASRQRDPGEALGELLRTLQLPSAAIPDSTEGRAAMFRDMLADRRMLVLLDDAASLEQVRPLLPGTPGNAVIITSRNRLTGLAGARLLSLGPLPQEEAVRLLAQIVGEERVAAEPLAASHLVQACGRMPLALRIAAARLASRPTWTLQRFGALLHEHPSRLDALSTGDLEVRASIMSAYDALDSHTRNAFRLLGLLGPIDVAEWVMLALTGSADARQVLDALVERSLVEMSGTDTTGEPRYRLHDLIRDLAEELVGKISQEERHEAMVRLANACLDLATRAERRMPREPHFPVQSGPSAPDSVLPVATAERLTEDPVSWFTGERELLARVVSWAAKEHEFALATRIGGLQVAFQHAQARFDDMSVLWEMILAEAARADEKAVVAGARHRLAAAKSWSGNNSAALDLLDTCVAEFELIGDEASMVLALAWRAFSANALGRFNEATAHAERGLRLAQTRGDRHAELMNLRMLGLARSNLGEKHVGLVMCRDAVHIARQLEEPVYEFLALNTAASTAVRSAQWGEAERHCWAGIDLIGRIGLHPTTTAYFLNCLGDSYAGRGLDTAAVEVWQKARTLLEDRGDRRALAMVLLNTGKAYRRMGESGTPLLQRASRIFLELDMPDFAQRAQAADAS